MSPSSTEIVAGFLPLTAINYKGEESPVWVNMAQVQSIVAAEERGSSLLMADGTKLHVAETPGRIGLVSRRKWEDRRFDERSSRRVA